MPIGKSFGVPSFVVVAALAGCGAPDPSAEGITGENGAVAAESQAVDTGPDSHAKGVHWTRDEFEARKAAAGGRKGGSPLMTFHGGKIMPRATTLAIFKGTSWGTYAGDEITGIDSWYTGI